MTINDEPEKPVRAWRFYGLSRCDGCGKVRWPWQKMIAHDYWHGGFSPSHVRCWEDDRELDEENRRLRGSVLQRIMDRDFSPEVHIEVKSTRSDAA